MKRPLGIVLCKESSYSVINALDPFSVILQSSNFFKVEFTDTSRSGKTARKSQKYFDFRHSFISFFIHFYSFRHGSPVSP